jgi:hypothetical protein
VDAAARALLERIAGRPDRDPVRVHLEALRRGNDDGALRALGAILGREGILRHGRDEGGAFWEICPAEVRASLLPVRPPSVSGA